MRDITAELKELRLYGMASAWEEVAADANGMGVQTSRWLIEHLLQAEHTDRVMRSIGYQMHAARFPVHRDLASFDFEQSKVDQKLIRQLADLSFADETQNVVFIGGTGTGKTHLAIALGIEAARQRRRVAFHRAADLVCALIEARDAKELGRFRRRLERVDLLIVDELGCAPRGANEPRGARSPPGTVAAVPRS